MDATQTVVVPPVGSAGVHAEGVAAAQDALQHFDLEPGHTREAPQVRRLSNPCSYHPLVRRADAGRQRRAAAPRAVGAGRGRAAGGVAERELGVRPRRAEFVRRRAAAMTRALGQSMKERRD